MWRPVVTLAALFAVLVHVHRATLEPEGSRRPAPMHDVSVAERCRQREGASSEASLCVLVGREVDVFVQEQTQSLPPSDNLLALSALRLNRTFIVFKLVLLLKIGSACPAMPAAALDSVTLQSSKTLEPGHVFVPDLTDALLVCAKVKESGMQL